MLGFIYDPKIQPGEYFFIDLITEKQKGVIGLRFSEIGKTELSTLSKELFHKLIVKLQKEYVKENVSFGTDKSGLKQLQEFIF